MMMHVVVHILLREVKVLLCLDGPKVVIARGDSIGRRVLGLLPLSSVQQAIVLLVTSQNMDPVILNGAIAFMRV